MYCYFPPPILVKVTSPIVLICSVKLANYITRHVFMRYRGIINCVITPLYIYIYFTLLYLPIEFIHTEYYLNKRVFYDTLCRVNKLSEPKI